MRLFVAGLLPDALQSRVYDALAAARRAATQARWVRPAQLHLTLAFLGELPGPTVPSLVEALQGVSTRHTALQLWLRGAGCFGRPHQPEVLYAELVGEVAGLTTLREEVQAALGPWLPKAGGGRTPVFRPHLTLARAGGRHGDAALGRCARALREQVLGTFLLERFLLFSSEPTPGGARHTALAEFALGPAASAHP